MKLHRVNEPGTWQPLKSSYEERIHALKSGRLGAKRKKKMAAFRSWLEKYHPEAKKA
jgi:hypothetical protein